MTLTEINTKLGEPWFKGGDAIKSILYADDSDVIEIVVERVFQVERTGSSLDLWEYTGEGELPTKATEQMEEDGECKLHSLNKWQARGCVTL